MTASADLNDLHKADQLPSDPRRAGKPVTEAAKAIAEDESRLVFEDELLRSSLEFTFKPQPGTCRLMTTGHYEIDDNTGGFEKEFVWFIGAETSWGKSSGSLMILDENMALGFRPIIVTWEDAPRLYGDRILCRRANVDALRYKKHRKGILRLEPEEIARLINEERKGQHRPIMLDARGRSVEYVRDRLKAMIRNEGCDMVMVDYLQAADNEKPQRDRRSQVNYIARTLVDVIKTNAAAGIIYSQLTEDEKKKVPNRESLRESRDLGHMAEVVAVGFVAKEEIRNKEGSLIAAQGDKVLFVDKVKDGPPRIIYKMDWDPATASFRPVRNKYRAFDDDVTAPFEHSPFS